MSKKLQLTLNYSSILGWFIKHETEKSKLELINNYLTNTFTNDDLDLDFEAVSNQSLYDLLQSITAVPHLAGDFQDIIVADYIKEKFVEFGLDYAEVRFRKIRANLQLRQIS